MPKTIIKKILIMVLFVLSLTLVSCSDSSTNSESSTNSDAKTNVEQKIVFYKTKLIEFVGGEGELEMEEMKRSVSSTHENIDREDLPVREAPNYGESGINPEYLIITADSLGMFNNVLAESDSFNTEDLFNQSYDSYEYTLKMHTEGDALYIESYKYSPGNNSAVWIDIMHFDLIDGKVEFKYVRDYRNLDNHRLYYDEFFETGNIVNIAFDLVDSKLTHYQLYDRELNKTLMLSYFASTLSMNFNTHDSNGDVSYSIEIDDQDEISRYSLQYREAYQDFWYSKYGEDIHLYYNLFLVDGWTRCRINDNGSDQIFIDDTEVLEDFDININLTNKSAGASITIPESEFTETFMNMSDFSLYFDFVTYSQLQTDISYIDDNFINILDEYGLTADMSHNYTNLLVGLPFDADEAVIQSLGND